MNGTFVLGVMNGLGSTTTKDEYSQQEGRVYDAGRPWGEKV